MNIEYALVYTISVLNYITSSTTHQVTPIVGNKVTSGFYYNKSLITSTLANLYNQIAWAGTMLCECHLKKFVDH